MDKHIEKIISDFVHAFAQTDYEKLEKLLAVDVISYVTNAQGGVNMLKGRDALIQSIQAVDYKSVKPDISITQLLKINENQGMVMVEIKAQRKGKTLHNFAAHLINTKQDLISEIRIVEALPAYSDEFWKN